jgi:hypothetical protein
MQEAAMIALFALPFSVRNFLDRGRLASMLERVGRDGTLWLSDWKSKFAALEVWFSALDFAGCDEVLLHDRTERFRRFCQVCEDDTPHEGFDELGAGWYAQICRCRLCGRQGMRVWALGWW